VPGTDVAAVLIRCGSVVADSRRKVQLTRASLSFSLEAADVDLCIIAIE
jgi:hypothetical protein